MRTGPRTHGEPKHLKAQRGTMKMIDSIVPSFLLHKLAQRRFQKLGTILYWSRVMSCPIPVHQIWVKIYVEDKKITLMRITWHTLNDGANDSAIAPKSQIGLHHYVNSFHNNCL